MGCHGFFFVVFLLYLCKSLQIRQRSSHCHPAELGMTKTARTASVLYVYHHCIPKRPSRWLGLHRLDAYIPDFVQQHPMSSNVLPLCACRSADMYFMQNVSRRCRHSKCLISARCAAR